MYVTRNGSNTTLSSVNAAVARMEQSMQQSQTIPSRAYGHAQPVSDPSAVQRRQSAGAVNASVAQALPRSSSAHVVNGHVAAAVSQLNGAFVPRRASASPPTVIVDRKTIISASRLANGSALVATAQPLAVSNGSASALNCSVQAAQGGNYVKKVKQSGLPNRRMSNCY
jgi:hypothetical protein